MHIHVDACRCMLQSNYIIQHNIALNWPSFAVEYLVHNPYYHHGELYQSIYIYIAVSHHVQYRKQHTPFNTISTEVEWKWKMLPLILYACYLQFFFSIM